MRATHPTAAHDGWEAVGQERLPEPGILHGGPKRPPDAPSCYVVRTYFICKMQEGTDPEH